MAARPYFLDLTHIRFPVGAICSIGHRVSGVVLALGAPFAVYLLGLSLDGPQGYRQVAEWLAPVPVRVGLILLVWAFAHHVLAGTRHLLMDIDVGCGLAAARRSAWIVNFAAFAVALLAAGALR
jgi:succinate dehydrogenase / fumarate reductase cytochrome b subunit